jgi:predicted DNA repair protein MutK
MASSLLALLDDIATMTKLATKKTAGVLGDDLALNAEQVSGVKAARELPVVWAVAKGSLVNKAILVPAALVISALAPWAIVPLLMLGGLFLCYEGAEKLLHKFSHTKAEDQAHEALLEKALTEPAPAVDLMALEKDKIKGAIRTDFILSAEIIVIALGTVAAASFGTRVGVLVSMAVLMTVGVYGLVAAIVKMDDFGIHLSQKSNPARAVGRGILWFAPWFMRGLSIAGTVAMFLVGGGILAHGVHAIQHEIDDAGRWVGSVPGVGDLLGGVVPTLLTGLLGLVAGAVVVAIVVTAKRLRRKPMA